MMKKTKGVVEMERKKLIGFYDYTVVLTYLGMVFAFAGIIKVLHGAYISSLICLMAAGVCDMFDGAVASTKVRDKYEKHFGIQIDSLCDLISFGVLPALFVYEISEENKFVGILTCGYVLCGLIRLAYFNVQEFERQQLTDEKREYYLGIPITTSAIVLPFAYLMYDKFDLIGTYIFIVALVLLGGGFVAGIEIKKPRIIGKIAMIAVGLAEMMGVILLFGARML